ncbi:MAG: NAD(P)-dependent oxidoreductase, partial [Patescibacteria group bacterium]
LINALQDGVIGGAGLDVITGEINGEISESPIVQYAKEHNNVIITPHIGGATFDEMRVVEEFITKKIIKIQEAARLVKI